MLVSAMRNDHIGASWTSSTHSPSIIAVLYSLGPSIHTTGECMGREQSRIGIIIRSLHNNDNYICR